MIPVQYSKHVVCCTVQYKQQSRQTQKSAKAARAIKAIKTDEVCRNFQAGRCDSGDRCPWRPWVVLRRRCSRAIRLSHGTVRSKLGFVGRSSGSLPNKKTSSDSHQRVGEFWNIKKNSRFWKLRCHIPRYPPPLQTASGDNPFSGFHAR